MPSGFVLRGLGTVLLTIVAGGCAARVTPSPVTAVEQKSLRRDALLVSLQAKPTVTFILRSPSGEVSTDSLTTMPDAIRSSEHIFSELDGEYTGDFTLIEVVNPIVGEYVVELSTLDSTSVVLDTMGDSENGNCGKTLRVHEPLPPGTTFVVFRYTESDSGTCGIELLSGARGGR